MKVTLMDLVKRMDELEDRIHTLDFLQKNETLKEMTAVEHQLFVDARKEWETEFLRIEDLLKKEIDVHKLRDICTEVSGNTIRLFILGGEKNDESGSTGE